jgi:hypothetical protein
MDTPSDELRASTFNVSSYKQIRKVLAMAY